MVVITWTVDELAGLASVLTPEVSPGRWHQYARNFASYRPEDPPARSGRELPAPGQLHCPRVGAAKVLCMKSELHLNQDGVKTGEGTATLPVKDFFQQIIAEAQPRWSSPSAPRARSSTTFGLGDVVVTRAAKFRLQNEFRNEPFNHQIYRSDWAIPTGHLDDATAADAALRRPDRRAAVRAAHRPVRLHRPADHRRRGNSPTSSSSSTAVTCRSSIPS